ncbi:MAG: hypothetical protein KDA61_17030, partial [Planctomycetales bacterium]|nr:hypothetical protein [Planctomycetales bacterium]
VAGALGRTMDVRVDSGATLTTFGQAVIDDGGSISLNGGKLDAQFVNINGGALKGSGEVFVGTGPITGVVRNLAGTVAPGGDDVGTLNITGDFSNLIDATLQVDLGGTATGLYDRLLVDRYAFLGGTLAVELSNPAFSPQVGDVFTVLTATEGVVGEFDLVQFPLGYAWNVAYTPTSVQLRVTGIQVEAMPGDFNNDGKVDSSDFSIWQAQYGSSAGNDGFDFLTWQRNFGPQGASFAAVPEPSMTVLAAWCAAGCLGRRRMRR